LFAQIVEIVLSPNPHPTHRNTALAQCIVNETVPIGAILSAMASVIQFDYPHHY
jgi:hypothetical protein